MRDAGDSESKRREGTVTVFFDGGCPLCAREIRHYRRLEALEPIEWVDITREGARLEAAGIGYEAAMERLHVLRADGGAVTGVPAFTVIWDRLPYYRRLASLVRGLRLVPLLEAAYVRFARRRYRSRCAQGACGLTGAAATAGRADEA